jgi:hypothetical protein
MTTGITDPDRFINRFIAHEEAAIERLRKQAEATEDESLRRNLLIAIETRARALPGFRARLSTRGS